MSSEIAYQRPTAKLRAWVTSLRAPFLTASALPALLGAFAAYWRTGILDAQRLLLSISDVVCLPGCDRINPEPTPFSGGSRVIQQKLVSPSLVVITSIAFFAIGTLQGLLLNSMIPGNIILKLGMAGLVCGVLYTAVPVKLSYRGLGELGVMLAFGPLLVAGTYVAQTSSLDVFPLLIGLPAGLLVASILLINEHLDIKWDTVARKRTLVVLLGARRGFLLYLATFFSAYALIGIYVFKGLFPKLAILGFLPLFPVAYVMRGKKLLENRQAMIRLSGMTMMSQMLTTGLIIASYLLQGRI